MEECEMPNAAVKGTSYSLNHTPELALHYGNTLFVEREAHPIRNSSLFFQKHVQSYDECSRYAPNLVYIGAMDIEELEKRNSPGMKNLSRYLSDMVSTGR